MRPPKLAIRAALGALFVAAILVLGAVSASAAPNPGYGNPGATIVPAQGGTTVAIKNPSPSYPSNNEPTENGPQTANIPTLAWVGEEVKLVACDDHILPLPFDGLYETAAFSIEMWTGDQAFSSTPTFNGSDASNIYINNQGSASFFFPTGHDGFYKGCVSADVKSLHSGLSVVKLDVAAQCIGGNYESTDGQGNDIKDPCGGGLSTTQVFSEQFIVIWMTPNAPTLTEASAASIATPGSPGTDAPPLTNQLSPVTGVANLAAFLGDPTGNGVFTADKWGFDTPWKSCENGAANANTPEDPCDVSNDTPATNNGLVQIKVTGSFPIEDAPPSNTNTAYFSSLTGNTNPAVIGNITLPKQWAALAGLMATGSEAPTGIQPNLWDIHGGPTNPLSHVASIHTLCPLDGPLSSTLVDAVDDCANVAGVGNAYSFSRVFGDFTTFGTVGPFDAQAPSATLLSDGRLNSDDAPMPALPVTLAIAPNAGGSDIGGVGGLYGVRKWLVYSHDFSISGGPGSGGPVALTTTGQGNLYNPYYQEYIPSTQRPISEASGVDGVYDYGYPGSSGGDFPGFSLGWTTPYTFWTALDNTTQDTLANTLCLRREGVSDEDPLNGPTPFYTTPYYPTSATVYTDERGEAYVDYNPGNGLYLNALIAPNGPITIDANGACDLQSLLGKPVGTSVISAQVQFPYQSVPYTAPKGANTLTKTIDSQWSKTLISYPKGNVSGVDVSIFVATATDINGQPFENEDVCFSVQGTGNPGVSVFQGIIPPTGTAPGANTNGATPDDPPEGTSGYTCADTNANGQAAVEVSGSVPGVDVTAWFVDEHIFRDVTTTLGNPTPVTSGTPPTVLPADPVVLHSGNAGSAGGSSSSSSAGGSGSGPASTSGPTSVSAANACKVASFHLYSKRGYAKVKVSCTQSKSDSIVMRAYKANGRLLHTIKVSIATGKTVTIHLSTKKVAHVTLSV